MKKILITLLVVMCMGTGSVSAENSYGFNDEIMEFLNENNVDLSIFAPIFNYNENPSAEVVRPVEEEIYRTRGMARTYDFTDIQVQHILAGYINTTLKWMHLEYAYLPKCKVTLNGQEINSEYRQYPLLQFRDITYFPMTYFDSRFLGVGATWTENWGLVVDTIDRTAPYNDYSGSRANEERYPVSGRPYVYICNNNIMVNGNKIDNESEAYPFIGFREIIYFPLTWEYAVEKFGWEYSYTEENGLIINSNHDISFVK